MRGSTDRSDTCITFSMQNLHTNATHYSDRRSLCYSCRYTTFYTDISDTSVESYDENDMRGSTDRSDTCITFSMQNLHTNATRYSDRRSLCYSCRYTSIPNTSVESYDENDMLGNSAQSDTCITFPVQLRRASVTH